MFYEVARQVSRFMLIFSEISDFHGFVLGWDEIQTEDWILKICFNLLHCALEILSPYPSSLWSPYLGLGLHN